VSELLIAFGGGLAATVTPCILPLYPAFLAYLTGQAPAGIAVPSSRAGAATAAGEATAAGARRVAPITAATLVLAGVLSGMVLIGFVFAIVSASLTRFIGVILPLADALLVGLGLLLVLGRNPFARLPQLSPAGLGRFGPGLGAFLYGLLFAPIALPCSGPFVVAVFAFSLTIGDVASQLLFFGVFGLGFGVPLFVIGLLAQWRGAQVARAIVRYERPIGIALGLALIAVGAWDLAGNLPTLLG
jgi:cytochrome c-type biogenesis protein